MDTKPTYMSSLRHSLPKKTQENEDPQLSSGKHMVHILKKLQQIV